MKKFIWLLLLMISSGFCNELSALPAPENDTLVIGCTAIPPFVINDNGNLKGISIDLWKMIADSLGTPFRYRIFKDFSSLMVAVKRGEVDLSINPFTVTGGRLSMFKMSMPFYNSNLGILTRVEPVSIFKVLSDKFLSWTFFVWLAPFVLLTLFFATLIWLVERRRNHIMFHSGWRGIGDGLWWAFVTMTTVGYGDKTPRTISGRLLSVVWMFIAIAMFFVITGVISSELTYSRMQGSIHNIHDLKKTRVGTIYKSSYSEILENSSVKFKNYFDPMDAIDAVVLKDIDAVFYDETILNYYIERYFDKKGLIVVSGEINPQYFCFLFNKEKTGLLERINPVLLDCIDSEEWQQITDRWETR